MPTGTNRMVYIYTQFYSQVFVYFSIVVTIKPVPMECFRFTINEL